MLNRMIAYLFTMYIINTFVCVVTGYAEMQHTKKHTDNLPIFYFFYFRIIERYFSIECVSIERHTSIPCIPPFFSLLVLFSIHWFTVSYVWFAALLVNDIAYTHSTLFLLFPHVTRNVCVCLYLHGTLWRLYW